MNHSPETVENALQALSDERKELDLINNPSYQDGSEYMENCLGQKWTLQW